jgi:hypothetical protein
MIGHSLRTLEELPYIRTMLKNLIIFRWLVVASLVLGVTIDTSFAARTIAQTGTNATKDQTKTAAPLTASPTPSSAAAGATSKAAAPAEEPPTEAEITIDAAIKKIGEIPSMVAELQEDVEMLGQKFTIKGRYLKAPSRRIYLRLTVAGLPDSSGTTLQVCDGETLWDYQQILENQYYRKQSIKPILEKLNAPELDPKIRDQALKSMGFAGPETLLSGLRKYIKFVMKESGQLDDKPVWILRGTWQNRQGIVGFNSQPVPQTGLLPPYVPCDATVYLGKEDSFPYRVDLLGREMSELVDTRPRGPDGRPIGARRTIERPTPSKIRIVYSNVKLNATIRVDEFAFQAPTTANVDDNTELILKMLDQAIANEAARKKNEAIRKDGPVLDQQIDIPPPPPATDANPRN